MSTNQAQILAQVDPALEQITPPARALPRITLVTLLSAVLCLLYAVAFYHSVQTRWFNPHWTTDDAAQQSFPFHRVYHPNAFKGDLITETMSGYLAPLHYAISYVITLLTADPVMTGHWVHLLQLAITLTFVFLAVRLKGGLTPAFLAVLWMLHSRNVMQRMTGGLPRGWAAPVLAMWLYYFVAGNQRMVLVTLLCGCLLHPPATLIAAVAYGLFLTIRVVTPRTRSAYLRPFVQLAIASPFYILILLVVLHRPPEIGPMATLDQAQAMPEFQRPGGRFPFLPFLPLHTELWKFGFQAFVGQLYNPGHRIKELMPYGVIALGFALVFIGARRKRVAMPLEFGCFLFAILSVYLASRALAFRLYVPDRHLQIPMGIFLVSALCVGTWRALHREVPINSDGASANLSERPSRCGWSIIGLALVAVLVFISSTTGLQGHANFNTELDRHPGTRAFNWLRTHSDEQSLIAGEPTFLDWLPLVGIRTAYATTETAHPFYPVYYREIERRLVISFRAHYARNFEELLNLLEPEKIDYFVFSRAAFNPKVLAKTTYFSPLDRLVRGLVADRDRASFAYVQLPKTVDSIHFPALVYKDDSAAIIDVHRLKEYLDKKKRSEVP